MARWVQVENNGSEHCYFDVEGTSGIVLQPVEKDSNPSTWAIEVYSGFGATDHFGLTGIFPSENAAADALRDLVNGVDVTPS